jgi:regulator of protease activity HflC (stomatin/prohibitin superfamily)
MTEAIGVTLLVLAVLIGSVTASLRRRVTVYEWQYGLKYRNGRFLGVLSPGRYGVWRSIIRDEVFLVGRNLQFQNLAPVDVTSSDRFMFRLGLNIIFRITDPRTAYENGYPQRLQMAAVEELSALIAKQTLDTVLADRAGLAETLKASLQARLADLTLEAVSIGAIALPPEIRRLATEVERAKLEGQAALERARSEHAALRSLANAARLLKDNPDLLSLRTLQALSPTGKGATLVLGAAGIPAVTPPVAAPAKS